MNKDSSIVKKIHPILRYETEACVEYLEKMAAKGLFIKSINNYVFCFEKTEPRKVKFYIDAFERASWFDTRAEEETLDYKEYCERAGWNYVCTEGKFQVFYTEDMEAVSIETDLNKRLKTILNGAMYQAVIHPFFIIAMMCMMMFNPVRLYFVRPNELIEMNYPLLGVLVLWFLLGVFAIFKLLDTVRFWISNKISIAKNNCMKMRSLKQSDRYMIISIFIHVIVLMCAMGLGFLMSIPMGVFLIAVCVVIVVSRLLFAIAVGKNKEKHSRKFNKSASVAGAAIGVGIGLAITNVLIIGFVLIIMFDGNSVKYTYVDKDGYLAMMFVSNDELPYTLEDAGYKMDSDGYRDKNAEEYKNVLCTQYIYTDEYYEDPDDEAKYSISYEKMEFKNAKWCKEWINNCLKAKDYQMIELPNEADKWGANQVYVRSYDYGYEELIVVYDDYYYTLSMNMDRPDEVRKIL